MQDNIMEFFKNNYEWLFSGIGLAIFTVIGKCLVNGFRRAKNIVNKNVIKKIAQKFELPPKIMTLVDGNGNLLEVEVILAFEFKDTKQEYVVYTMHEKDRHHNITVYVSEVDRSNGETKLIGVDNEKEWKRVVNVLKELADADVNALPEYDETGIEII